MQSHPYATLTLLGTLVVAPSASAQTSSEPRQQVARHLEDGDKIRVRTVEGREARGRYVAGQSDALVLEVDGRPVSFEWSQVDEIRRRKNGILLGALIGAAAGAAAGVPLYQLAQNETGDGGAELAGMIALGLGAGVAIDAIFARDKTVYRRPAVTRSLHVMPERGGGSVRLRIAW